MGLILKGVFLVKISEILVIGGAGYVGSHFCLFASNSGIRVTVMDNLSKGHKSALRCSEFIQADLLDYEALLTHLSHNRYDAIFHFAASCLVGESVQDPAQYYKNNLLAALNMAEAMRHSGHDRLVFRLRALSMDTHKITSGRKPSQESDFSIWAHQIGH